MSSSKKTWAMGCGCYPSVDLMDEERKVEDILIQRRLMVVKWCLYLLITNKGFCPLNHDEGGSVRPTCFGLIVASVTLAKLRALDLRFLICKTEIKGTVS